ncbi:ASCH domain containing protein [uncultured Caudovirales phage]|uniref:ASCH domain containing protein n=1 Tax=uncultured Caudovirales phage TaxID=2100421 RepID=A0A6J5LK92_9CAUD|nr:ASCH domain containing protein [uncultured Caudovirales phage]
MRAKDFITESEELDEVFHFVGQNASVPSRSNYYIWHVQLSNGQYYRIRASDRSTLEDFKNYFKRKWGDEKPGVEVVSVKIDRRIDEEDDDTPTIGINVRSDVKAGMPYADLIVDGIKTYESRESNSLKPYIGKRVAIVKTGEGKAQAIGSVIIGKPIVVDEQQFRELEGEHMVPAGSAFDIKQGEKKYLYPVTDAIRFETPIEVGHGIVSRKLNIDEEELDEGASSVLYHYTGTLNALEVLQSGEFKLSSVTGTQSEKQYAPEGYPYFFSTTRTRVGDYHRYVGSSGVMFVLDGNWFGQRYPVKPIDYWERAWQHAPDRSREAEDRVFSQEPAIPIDGVKQIHVLIKEQHDWRSPATRKLLILSKKRGIPVFLYDDEAAWRLLDKRKAISVKQAAELIGGQEQTRTQFQSAFNYLTPWLELIYKNKISDLSPEASKLRYSIIYQSNPREDNRLGVDMGNARKPSSGEDYDTAVKINDYMRKNGFKTTVDLKNAIQDKWKDIKA